MACGHCRRPRKEILASNFDQLCWVRGLSSSPKSQGGSKVMLRGSKMAPEITSWDAKNSPGRPEAHPGPPLALPAPRKAPGSVRAAADCTPPGGRPGGASVPSVPQPTSPPSPLENLSLHFSYYLFPSFSTTPHARRGRRIRDGLRPLPPTPCPPAPLPGVLLARQPPCPEADTLSSGCAEHPARFREMRGACGAQEIVPVAQVAVFHPQPPAPQNSTKASPTRVPPLVPPSNTPPHASSPSGVGGLYFWAGAGAGGLGARADWPELRK